MPFKDKERNRIYQRDWAKRNRAKRRAYTRRLRERVITKLGGKCVKCGCNEFDALEINHINGGGRKEKKKWDCSKSFWLAILKGTRKTDDLEVRCRLCNSYHYLKEIKKVKSDWKIIWNGSSPNV